MCETRTGEWIDIDKWMAVYVEDGVVVKADHFDHFGKVYVHNGKEWVLREDLTLDEFKEYYEKGNMLIKK